MLVSSLHCNHGTTRGRNLYLIMWKSVWVVPEVLLGGVSDGEGNFYLFIVFYKTPKRGLYYQILCMTVIVMFLSL